MQYALGHAFTSKDLFYNLKIEKLQVKWYELDEMFNEHKKKIFAYRIFRECCKIVINDIIDNDVEFLLPVGKKRTSLMIKEIPEAEFKRARQHGKFMEIDFLVTLFKTYDMCLHMYGCRNIDKRKNVYLNKELKLKIIDNVNSGRVYYGKNIKHLKDYYEQIFQMFPKIPKSDIKKVLNFGWKSLYLHNSYGGDTLIKDEPFWFYIGSMYRNSISWYNYYRRKLSVKLRVLHKRKNVEWDGYYYFALNDEEYEYVTKGKGKKGRPKKYFTFKNKVCYKIFLECNICSSSRKHIFRTKALVDIGYSFYRKEFSPLNIEEYLNREPLKLVDILITNHDYEYL